MLFTQLCFNTHTITHIMHIATLLPLTFLPDSILSLAFLVHDCAVKLPLPNYRTSQRKPLNCRTLIDLLPPLKYDDCCRPWPPFRQLAAYRDASFPLSFRSLPYTPLGRCWLGTVFLCVIFAARAGLSAECPQYLHEFHSPRVGFRHCCPL
jgi:hypothetical protein